MIIMFIMSCYCIYGWSSIKIKEPSVTAHDEHYDHDEWSIGDLSNQKQESPVEALFVNGSDEMSNLYRGPSIDVSYQVSDNLAKRFQRRKFLEMDQSETRIASPSAK
jgi:hypothetical protein